MTLRLEGKWMIAAGAVWIAAAIVLPIFVIERQATQTVTFAGITEFFTISPGTLLFESSLGIVRIIALFAASLFLLFVGVCLCVFGATPKEQ